MSQPLQHAEQSKRKPHISAREYIRWPPHAPYENTNTLVVTSSAGRFVDIRDRKHHAQILADMPDGGVFPSHALEWAFAGVASNDTIKRKDGTSVMHSSWRHLVDSRLSNKEAYNFKDEGEMMGLQDGRTLEKGKMVNPLQPEHGAQSYEECWADVTPVSQRADGKVEVCVLQLTEPEVDASGMVVRVGHVCQGMVRIKEDYACERYLWTREGGWKRVFRDGRIWMPTGLATEMEKLQLEDKVANDYDQPWKVVELGFSD